MCLQTFIPMSLPVRPMKHTKHWLYANVLLKFHLLCKCQVSIYIKSTTQGQKSDFRNACTHVYAY